MNNLSRLCAFILVFALPLSVAGKEKTKETSAPPLVLTAEESKKLPNTVVFVLTNRGSQSVKIPTDNLPWATHRALTIFVAKARDRGQLLKTYAPLENPLWLEQTEIVAGKSVTGSIDLTERAPDVAKARQTDDVLVFWVYDLEKMANLVGPRLYGMVELKRTK